MMKEQIRHKIDVFNAGDKDGCTRQQLLDIRSKFITRIQEDTCLQCCECEKMLDRVIFVYQENSCYCIGCFKAAPKERSHAFVFADLAIDDPLLQKWRLSEELELLHLTHELGVEDTQLLAHSMTIPKRPKTASDVQDFYEQIEAAKPLPSQQELNRWRPQADQRQEVWFKIYHQFKERLEEADANVLDYILGEMHERSDSDLKSFALQQFQSLTYQRAKMYGQLEKLSKKYPQRHKKPKIIFSSSSESLSLSDLSIKSDSPEFEQFKFQSRMLLQEIDSLIRKHSSKEKQIEEVVMPAAPVKAKQVLFLEDIIEEESQQAVASKTKRISRIFSKSSTRRGGSRKKTRGAKIKKSEENESDQND